jgi:hypothetical protein
MATVTINIKLDAETMRAATASVKELGQAASKVWVLMPRKKKKKFKKIIKAQMEDIVHRAAREAVRFK